MFDIVNEFLSLEKKKDCFSIAYNGFAIWPFIRLELFRILESYIGKFSYQPVYLRQIPMSKCSNEIDFSKLKNKECDYLIITNKHRMVREKDEYICPITGFFETIENKCVTLCHSYKPMRKYEYSHTDIPYKVSNAATFSMNEDIECLNAIKDFCSHFVTEEEISHIIKKVKMMIEYVAEVSKLSDGFDEIICKLKPQLIFFSSAYSIPNMFFIYVAKKHNIKTIELQHGLIGNRHIAYNCLCENIQHEFYPDYLMTYGEFDKETPRHIIPQERILPVGNYLLEKYLKVERRDKDGVLIVGNISNNSKLISFALDLKKQCPETKIIYRIHSEEKNNEEDITTLENCGIHVSKNHHKSIYEYLNTCKWIVGTVSTVLIEALRFKCNVCALVDENTQTKCNKAIEKINCFNKELLIKMIKTDDYQSNINIKPYYFYTKFSEENFQKNIDNIIKEKVYD